MVDAIFQSTRPIRGATLMISMLRAWLLNFNPRAPYGARLWLLRKVSRLFDISIHAPHTGRDKTG